MSDTYPDLSLLYRCFSLDHNEDDAAAAFERHYGRKPEWVFEEKNNLWVGPIKGSIPSIPPFLGVGALHESRTD